MEYLVFEVTIMEPMMTLGIAWKSSGRQQLFLQSHEHLDEKRKPIARCTRRLDLDQNCQAIQLISVAPISSPNAFSYLLSAMGVIFLDGRVRLLTVLSIQLSELIP